MKAIVISEAGGPEKLQYTDVPTPQVKPGWSLVQVKPEKIYSLSEVPEAHRYLASHNSLGKVIVLNR